MSLTSRTYAAVWRALARLAGRYGRLDVVGTDWPQSRAAYERTVERFEAGTVGGAGAWVRDDAGRALVVRQADAEGWAEPGGKQEPGESLHETARRETREEAGVEVDLLGVVRAQVARHTCTDEDRPTLYRLIVVFDARYVGGDPRPGADEIAEVRWATETPEPVRYPLVREYPVGEAPAAT